MSLATGKVLLTGATGGIGHAIARAFARRGAALLLSGRREHVLGELAREVGGRVIAADLSNPADVDALARAAGDVDVAVFNAGLPASGPILEYTSEQIDRALMVNLRAPIMLTRALVPAMVARGRGHVVFISSVAGKAASPGSSLYSATKFGLRGFALCLREDLHETGVGVSVVLTGFISDAGLFADTGIELPRGVGTRNSDEVASAVIGAVERNRAEVVVAPMPMRIGTNLAGLVPQTAAAVSRRMGSPQLAEQFSDAQRHLR